MLTADDAGEVESKAEGMKLLAKMGEIRIMHGSAGAAAEIGIEDGK